MSDGGDLTVGRRIASYVYGDFRVVVPEGREQQETDDRLKNGYIAKPKDIEDTGRFDIRFKRSDATIDLAAGTSDLKESIDAAQKVVSGDTFFQRDISDSGIGNNRPGVDFKLGDTVNVLLWGKVLPSKVTALDMVNGNAEKWRVHVGGQILKDPARLKKINNELEQQIHAERQQRLRDAGAIMEKAQTAQDTANNAIVKADQAEKTSTETKTTVNNVVSEFSKLDQKLGEDIAKRDDQNTRMWSAITDQDSKLVTTETKLAEQIVNNKRQIDTTFGNYDKKLQDGLTSLETAYKEADQDALKKIDESTAMYLIGLNNTWTHANDAVVSASLLKDIISNLFVNMSETTGLSGALVEQANRLAINGINSQEAQNLFNATQSAINTVNEEWKATQDRINENVEETLALQEKTLELHNAMITALKKQQEEAALKNDVLKTYFGPHGMFIDTPTDPRVKITRTNTGIRLDFAQLTLGQIAINQSANILIYGQLKDGTSILRPYSTKDQNFNNTIICNSPSSSNPIEHGYLIINFLPGIQIDVIKKLPIDTSLPTSDSWVTLSALTWDVALMNADVLVDLTADFKKITYWSPRGVRILRNGQVIQSRTSKRVGKLFFMNSYTMKMVIPSMKVNAGDKIEVQVLIGESSAAKQGMSASTNVIYTYIDHTAT